VRYAPFPKLANIKFAAPLLALLIKKNGGKQHVQKQMLLFFPKKLSRTRI
jgi:hypothetical protein